MAARLHSNFALSGLQDGPAQDSAGAGGDKRTRPDLLELRTDAHEHTENNDANDELDDLNGTHTQRVVVTFVIHISNAAFVQTRRRPNTSIVNP